MAFALKPGVTFCDVSDRIVFLDVNADRYFILAEPAERTFRDLINGTGNPGEEAAVESLSRSGVIVPANGSPGPMPCRLRGAPTQSLLDAPKQPGAVREKFVALPLLAATRIKLRRLPLHLILDELALAKPIAPKDSVPAARTLQNVATAFEWTTRLVRSHDQCLVRSLAVARRLANLGIASELVIGVRLRPFAAHSWVQTDEWLVNDRPDTVRTYTPILTV